MAVKILIKRRFKEGHFNEINRMLKKVRYGAMDEDGYLSSETLWITRTPSGWWSLRTGAAWMIGNVGITAPGERPIWTSSRSTSTGRPSMRSSTSAFIPTEPPR